MIKILPQKVDSVDTIFIIVDVDISTSIVKPFLIAAKRKKKKKAGEELMDIKEEYVLVDESKCFESESRLWIRSTVFLTAEQ